MSNSDNKKKNLIPTKEVPSIPHINLPNKENCIETMYIKGEQK